ncbi:hypothetical protein GPECTOR_1g513 [Gonium pectorale]|uniref:Uncharacterized protein n=1 Tax=Gonium pectorale TaxID=33097 RepID=A0A150H3C5_GONPE|nr:hypothetical protein GPECTOR_1g513 [Gonium pectorale]|eukprot:KXZ56571.1 hypothetical protein GPECTOR_1g513 [Gonium pectorale]
MGVIPLLLGRVGQPLVLTYKSAKVGVALTGARHALTVADAFVSFALDINGKTWIGLAWLAIKFAHGKRRCQRLADETHQWIERHRSVPVSKATSDKALEADLDAWLRSGRAAVAKPETQPSPLTRAGLLFLRDCLARMRAGDEGVAAKFRAPDGRLDVRGALLALYGTPTSRRLAEALAEEPSSSSAPPASSSGGPPLQSLIDGVYTDLRLALRRDLMEMLVY